MIPDGLDFTLQEAAKCVPVKILLINDGIRGRDKPLIRFETGTILRSQIFWQRLDAPVLACSFVIMR